MVEQNPWKTPFGKVLIAGSVVAAVLGFTVAAMSASGSRSEEAQNLTDENDDNLSADLVSTDSHDAAGEPADSPSEPPPYSDVLSSLPTASSDPEEQLEVTPQTQETEGDATVQGAPEQSSSGDGGDPE